MITYIGLCAGEVWRYLDKQNSDVSIKDLCAGIKAPRETILMAVGWLGREGYILIKGDLDACRIGLNPKPPQKK